jgi:D-alanine-D-alanine ligase
MNTYKNIAVIYGSDSSEWEVSCRSGEFTASRLDETRYSIYEVFARFGKWQLVAYKKQGAMNVPLPEGARPEIDKTDFSVTVLGEKIKFDYAFIMEHGHPGEDGLLQGYLEMLGVPFSSCGAFVSAIAFDKFACKSYIRDVDFVQCAPDILVRKGDDLGKVAEAVNAKLRYPVFVKPTDGGSSFGVTKVHEPSELIDAIKFSFSEGPTAIIEQGITGRELTCAAYLDGGEVKSLPVIEIVSDNDYFDYDAKYNGHSRELCPAPIEKSLSDDIQRTSQLIYRRLGCKGLVRMDYIVGEEGIFFLEVNTIPGMTNASLVPKMVRAAGMDMTDFLNIIIDNS